MADPAIAAVGGCFRFLGRGAASHGERDLPSSRPTHLLALAVFVCLVAAVFSVLAALV